jgi:hypothetical protein
MPALSECLFGIFVALFVSGVHFLHPKPKETLHCLRDLPVNFYRSHEGNVQLLLILNYFNNIL